jgi:biotin synthase
MPGPSHSPSIADPHAFTETAVLDWLRTDDARALDSLWLAASQARRDNVGDAVHLRGLVEFSNHCRRACAYCGISVHHRTLRRYRLDSDEILRCAHRAKNFGYGTLVLQSGEDLAFTGPVVADLVRRIKSETGLAVTLSLGERSPDDLARWREAGADRYLLRFETSDPLLFRAVHPSLPEGASDRISLLRTLRALGYEIGSGVMIGIPGQSLGSLARDILLFRDLDLDMIGVGPFLLHPATPLGRDDCSGVPGPEDQVPATETMVYKVLALARLVCPEANIPSTTALATLNRESGRELGLERGANVVMPNLTPREYRRDYEIYPSKVCIDESDDDCRACLVSRIRSRGRTIGTGPGGRARGLYLAARESA